MHTDKLGRPISKGDVIVYGTTIDNGIDIYTVADLCTTSKGKKCVRIKETSGLVSADRVLVINREMRYTKEHYPELLV